MTEKSIGKNMLLISSAFRGVKSFSMVPVTQDCPYVEVMFDPSSAILAVISKVKKQAMHMVPRLDESGQPIRLKSPNMETGKTVKEQRMQIETFSEFYITEKEEILQFVNIFAINSQEYNIEEYFVNVKETKTSNIILP
jgi:Na+-transporting NADH:ubiquinone oxidoreductase subunit NqrC